MYVFYDSFFTACPPAPQCGAGLVAKEIRREHHCSEYDCVSKLTCSIEGEDMTSFDGAVSNVDLCGHIIAQQHGEWKVIGMF
jgi:hypothetical protein